MRRKIKRFLLIEDRFPGDETAPFVLVGEGGGAQHETGPALTPATAASTSVSTRPKKRVTTPDWRTEV
jgi:hypothetical protein